MRGGKVSDWRGRDRIGPVSSVYLINAFLLRAQTPNEDPTVPEGRVLKKSDLHSCWNKTQWQSCVKLSYMKWLSGLVERSRCGKNVGKFGHESEMLWVCMCVVTQGVEHLPVDLVSPSRIFITPPLSVAPCNHFFCDTMYQSFIYLIWFHFFPLLFPGLLLHGSISFD